MRALLKRPERAPTLLGGSLDTTTITHVRSCLSAGRVPARHAEDRWPHRSEARVPAVQYRRADNLRIDALE
jgi:hypothetical protein